MKFYFFDTSGAAKLSCIESGTDRVSEIYDAPDHGILISNLTYTEVLSALNRKKQAGVISQSQFDDAVSKFF